MTTAPVADSADVRPGGLHFPCLGKFTNACKTGSSVCRRISKTAPLPQRPPRYSNPPCSFSRGPRSVIVDCPPVDLYVRRILISPAVTATLGRRQSALSDEDSPRQRRRRRRFSGSRARRRAAVMYIRRATHSRHSLYQSSLITAYMHQHWHDGKDACPNTSVDSSLHL